MATLSKEARLDALVEKMHGFVNQKSKARPRFSELVQRRSIKDAVDVMRAFKKRIGIVPLDVSPTYRGGVQLDYPMEQPLQPEIDFDKQLGLEIEVLEDRTISLCLPDWTELYVSKAEFMNNMRQYIGNYGRR